jgi:glucose-1-phosphate cytidylyltransferase
MLDRIKCAVILAGGLGSRLENLTKLKPKPLITIKNKPILMHIIELYLKFNVKNFIIPIGYKGEKIIEFFSNKKVDLKKKIIILEKKILNKKCKITLIKTGIKTMTGGRVKQVGRLIKDREFFLTYGDGLSNVNIRKLEKLHKKEKKLITVTAVNLTSRFGELKTVKNKVVSFEEKKKIKSVWINGGFFVVNRDFLKHLKNNQTVLEKEPLEKMVRIGQLNAFKHTGFWECVDTKRDRDYLNKLFKKNYIN